MPYKCPKAKAENRRQYYLNNKNSIDEKKRQWYQDNKEAAISRSVARTKRITNDRKKLLSQFPCVCCRNPDPDVIQWHHVDPSSKEITVFCGGYGEEKFWNEVLKCIPLCANCHVKLHKEKLCLLPIHL